MDSLPPLLDPAAADAVVDPDRIVALLVLQFLVAAVLWLASPRHGSVPLPRRLPGLSVPLPGGGMDVRLLWLPGLMLPAGLLFFSAALEPVWRPLIPVAAFTGLPISLVAGLALASWGLQAQLGRMALGSRTPLDGPALLMPLMGALWLGGWIGLMVGGAMAAWALLLAWLLQVPPSGTLAAPGVGGEGRHGAHGGPGAFGAASWVPALAAGVVVLLLALTPLGADPLL